MKGKSRLIKSIFMLIIATLFSSLCITFAWFISIREQDVGSTGISMTGLEGNLYYYNGNKVADDWCGYPEVEKQTGKNKGFGLYDKTQTVDSPFVMSEVKPSARFLFFVRAKVKDQVPASNEFEISFTATDWESTYTGEPRKDAVDKNHPWFVNQGVEENINLTRAIEFYVSPTPLPASTLPTSEERLAADADSVITWADGVSETDNVFKQTANHNTTNNPVSLNKNGTPYTFKGGQTEYLIPFIIEFSDDPDTWFSGVQDPSGSKFILDPTTGNSNVYMGQTFVFTELVLSHSPKATPTPSV